MPTCRLLLLITAVLVACDRAPATDSAELPGDSMTIAARAALERFRATVRGSEPDTIAGGAASRDELVHRFAAAVQRADTTALIRMTMNRAEFAYLYYPHTIYTRPPYQLDPETAWMLSKASAEKGLTRVLERFGGKPLTVLRYECAAEPKQEGPNRFWHDCTLAAHADGAPAVMRWFGSIWERDGRFKFVSYANDL